MGWVHDSAEISPEMGWYPWCVFETSHASQRLVNIFMIRMNMSKISISKSAIAAIPHTKWFKFHVQFPVNWPKNIRTRDPNRFGHTFEQTSKNGWIWVIWDIDAKKKRYCQKWMVKICKNYPQSWQVLRHGVDQWSLAAVTIIISGFK